MGPIERRMLELAEERDQYKSALVWLQEWKVGQDAANTCREIHEDEGRWSLIEERDSGWENVAGIHDSLLNAIEAARRKDSASISQIAT